MKKKINKLNCKILLEKEKIREKLLTNINTLIHKNVPGEGYIETAIKIIIVIVIGAAILGILYLMFKDTLLPKIQEQIMSMFDFNG